MRARLAGVNPAAPGQQEPVRHRMFRLPTTRLGRLSLALLGIAIAVMVIPMVAVAAGVDNQSALILEIVLLAIPMFSAFVSAVAAGVVAAVALFRRGERSLLLALPLLVSALALMFVIGEATTPH